MCIQYTCVHCTCEHMCRCVHNISYPSIDHPKQHPICHAHQALTWYWRKCLINDITAGVRRQRNPQPLTSPTPEVRLLQQNGVVWSSNRHRKGTIGSPTVWVFTSWKMASKVIENHGTVIEMLQIVQVHVHEDMCAFYIQYINKYILKFVYKSMYYNIWGSIHVYIYTYTGCTTNCL